MKSDKEKLRELLERIRNPEAPPLTAGERALLEDFRNRYPFFPLTAENPAGLCAPEGHARLDGIPQAPGDEDFYPPEKGASTPSTLAAIDDFLNTYGHQSAEEDALLERLIFNPIPDYAQQLAAREQAELPAAPAVDSDSRDARINRFILSQKSQADSDPKPQQTAIHPSEGIPVNTAGEMPDATVKKTHTVKEARPPVNEKPGLLSESLAKIYIKTHRYERAYEILNDLSLRFPGKNRYFADQLRFLRKLIRNEQQLRAGNAGKE